MQIFIRAFDGSIRTLNEVDPNWTLAELVAAVEHRLGLRKGLIRLRTRMRYLEPHATIGEQGIEVSTTVEVKPNPFRLRALTG